MTYNASYHSQRFVRTYPIRPGGSRYARSAIEYLYKNKRYVGKYTNRYALRKEVESHIREEYGMGPVTWMFLRWLIIPIIKYAIEYWLGELYGPTSDET